MAADLAALAEDESLQALLKRSATGSKSGNGNSDGAGDLRVYARMVDEQLREAESDSVGAYVLEADRFASLYTQLGGCEEVLTDMLGQLQSFQ